MLYEVITRTEEHLAPLLDALSRTGRPYDTDAVRAAYDFAAAAHAVPRGRCGHVTGSELSDGGVMCLLQLLCEEIGVPAGEGEHTFR